MRILCLNSIRERFEFEYTKTKPKPKLLLSQNPSEINLLYKCKNKTKNEHLI